MFLLCLIMIIELLRFCNCLSVLRSLVLFFWWSLIEGLFSMYSIFVRLELICDVRWMCCDLLLERLFELCDNVRYLRLMLFRKVSCFLILCRMCIVIFCCFLFSVLGKWLNYFKVFLIESLVILLMC